ncbi:MAG: DUF389 domain-containing protein [Methylococcaceae bacterium]
MTQAAHRFGVLDDLGFYSRSGLLILCSLTCCWGFVNNTVLLVFASKIGFPMAVAVCSVTVRGKHIVSVLYYTILLCITVFLYFLVHPFFVMDAEIISRYYPSRMDFYLAMGLGFALSAFWYHPIRINLIVASAGLASLLPACIMTGYHLARVNLDMVWNSQALYGEYVLGLVLGSLIHQEIEYVVFKLKS